VQTAKAADGSDDARVRHTVLDASTFAFLPTGEIGTAGHDPCLGSMAVNADGGAVIGYNRSGQERATDRISFMARTFVTASNGALAATGDEILLKESMTDDDYNGALFGQPAAGSQRWGNLGGGRRCLGRARALDLADDAVRPGGCRRRGTPPTARRGAAHPALTTSGARAIQAGAGVLARHAARPAATTATS
jgi:hypothetical protein